jgi:D-sedoheptulose 7-phosphate isomerase
MMIENIKAGLKEAQDALERLLSDDKALLKIESAGRMLIETFENKGRIFSCGNGGSMCDAMHFAEELTGRYRKNRKGYPAIAISDPGYLSCAANDFGYDRVFSRYLEANAVKGDSLIAISTSGKSPSILEAAGTAKALGLRVIVLAGAVNADLEKQSDLYICTPGGNYADRVQELHIKVLHIFIEMIERHFHPENYG